MASPWDDLDLEKLLQRARKQDPRAWGQIVDRFQSLVYSVPRRYRLSADDSEDVFQSTFQALHQSLDRIEAAQTLPKWLSTTATRITLRTLRSRNRSVTTDEPDTLDELLRDEDNQADAMAIQAESADLVRQGVLQLPDKCRQLLSLLYFEDEKSYQDISAALGLPMGAIGPNRARCLERLKKYLLKHGFGEEDVPGVAGPSKIVR